MRTRMLIFVICIVLSVAALLGADSIATVYEGEGRRHLPSSALFPSHTEVVQGQLLLYNPVGTDVSVGYSHETIPLAITLYVYPAFHPLVEELEHAVNEIYMHHSPKEPVSPASSVVAQNGSPGYAQEFEYTEYMHTDVQPLVSRVELYRRGGWFVMARMTVATSDAADGRRIVQELFSAMEWPEPIRALPVTIARPYVFSYDGVEYADAFFGHFSAFLQMLREDPRLRPETVDAIDLYSAQANRADAALLWSSGLALGVPALALGYLLVTGELYNDLSDWSTAGWIAGGTLVGSMLAGTGLLLYSMVSDPGLPFSEVGQINRDLMGPR